MMLRVLCVCVCVFGAITCEQYTSLGNFKTSNPAFVQVFPTGPTDADALWITDFSALLPGRVRYVQNISNALQSGVSNLNIEEVDGTFVWPNLISSIPTGAIPSAPDAVALVPDGFLVPGKGTGGLYVLTRSIQRGKLVLTKNITLVAQQTGWFYHMALWIDLDNDGLLDVITARAKNNYVSFAGELVWLKQPASNALSGPWKEEVLAKGPDFIFAVTDLNPSDNLLQLYAAQFFSSKIVLYDIATGSSPSVKHTVTIAKVPSPEDIHIIDLNLDGTLEILFSEHDGGAGGNVTSSTIPSNYLDSSLYAFDTLATGFNVTESGLNQAAPGFLTPFWINQKDEESGVVPPSILVAGDGSQSAYIMTPVAGKDFVYDTEVVLKVDGVIGIIAAGYLAPGGYTDFFVPDYDENKVYVYQYGN